jgi:hypothetical protein
MADQPANDPNNYTKGAADRAHGTHGRGGEEEVLDTNPPVDPGFDPKRQKPDPAKFAENLEGHMGAPGFGQEQSGGSSVDQRPDRS